MKLIHVTEKRNYENLQKKGLVAGYEPVEITSWLTNLLNICKPDGSFADLDIEKCTWLSPENTEYRLLLDEETLHLVIDSEILDINKLFYVDGRISEKIKQSYNSSAKEIVKAGSEYWHQLKPFSEYVILHGEKKLLSRHIDVLYFDDIPPEDIEILIS